MIKTSDVLILIVVAVAIMATDLLWFILLYTYHHSCNNYF